MADLTPSTCRALVPVGPLLRLDRHQPQAVVSLHPFGLDRRVRYALLEPGESIAAYFDRIGLAFPGPVVLTLSGRRVPRELWRVTRPRPGQLIEVQAVVQGGNGTGQKVVGAILMVVGVYFGQPWLFNIGSQLYASGWLTAVSSWLSPRKDLSSRRSTDSSPTYSLTGAQNQARPYQPLPVVLGTHRIVPDFATQPYTEFEGEEQYLYAVFHFGIDLPGLAVRDIKIGDTPIEEFEEVTTQWSDAAGNLTLVAGNVDTVPGAALGFADGWITRVGSADATALAIDIEGLLFWQGQDGPQPRNVFIGAEYRQLPAGAWQGFFVNGTGIAASYWSRGFLQAGIWQQIDFDTNLAAGAHTEGEAAGEIYVGGDSGGYAQPLIWSYRTFDAARAAGWATPSQTFPVGNADLLEIVNGTTKPLRRTYRREVPLGQYEVRVRRATLEETDSRVVSQMSWSVLRSYQRDSGAYAGQKRLAVRIRASGQLSGNLNTLNAIAESRAWVWRPDLATWRFEPTSNPAWLSAFVAQGVTVGGRLVFGLGLDVAQIDWDAVRAWAAWNDLHGHRFNAVIDREISNGELLDAIAVAGYGGKTFAPGRLSWIWDAENQPISGVVAMANIKAGSMRVSYATAAPVDEVVGVFINADNGYAQEEVRKLLPGVTNPRRTERVELFGITSRAQAGRFINLRVASLLYRKKFIEWEQDAEGGVHRRGDVLALSHDLTQWGYSGRLISISGAAPGSVVQLDRRVPANLAAVNDEWLGVHVPGESGYRVLRVQCVGSGPDSDADTVTLVDPWPAGVDLPGATRPALDYIWVYDFKATPGLRVKLLDWVPRANERGSIEVKFAAVPDGAEYYAGASGSYTVVAPQTLLDSTAAVTDLVITQEDRVQGSTFWVELTATWNANSRYALAEVIGTVDGVPQGSLGRTEPGRRRFSWRGEPGQSWVVTVQPYNALGQPGAALSSSIVVINQVPPPPDTFTVFRQPDGTRQFDWSWTLTPKPADLEGVVIRYSANTADAWDAMRPLVTDDGFFTASPLETNQLLAGTYVFEVRSRDTTKQVSSSGRRIVAQLDDPRLGSVLDSFDVRALGWPGTLTDCFISQPNNWLEALSNDTWATLPATWDAWTRWNQTPRSPIRYQHPTIDLGAPVVMRPLVQVDAAGTVTVEEQHSLDNVTYTAWAAASASFNARYVRVRVSVAATVPDPVPTIRSLQIAIDAPIKTEDVNDFVPASLTGSYRIGVGDIRVPITGSFAAIRTVLPVVQSATGDWSFRVVDKNTSPGPRVQFLNGGVLADPPLADCFIKGF
jgi:hypothetical protein